MHLPKRRQLILAAGTLLAVSRAAWSQQARKQWRIGVIANEPWSALDGLPAGLKERGYTEGQDLRLEYRWFEGRPDRLPALAADLVRLKVDVIVTVGTPAAIAAKQATASIPIVMGLIGDPVGAGLVQSIARPGGNLTGVSVLAAELEPKRLEALKELIPNLARVTVLWNPKNPYGTVAMKHAQGSAEKLGLRLEQVGITGPDDMDRGFAALAHSRPQAVLVVADQMLLTQRMRIAEYLAKNRLPSAFTYREHVEAGGLLSYSTNYYDAFRRAADYVDRIIKGAKAGELPVEQATRFDLVLNRGAARAMGITIPEKLLFRADRVIE